MVVLLVKNYPGNNTALLSEWLGCETEVVSPSEGFPLPVNTDRFSGIIVLGGPQPAHHVGEDPGTAWFPELRRIALRAHYKNQPLLGICLGAQLLALAHGGEVSYLDNGPDYSVNTLSKIHPIEDPLFSDIPDHVPAFEWHQQEVSRLPDKATWLLTSEHTAVEAFSIGTSYGIQYHFDYSEQSIDEHVKLSYDSIVESGRTPEYVGEEFKARLTDVHRVWRPFVESFAALCEKEKVDA